MTRARISIAGVVWLVSIASAVAVAVAIPMSARGFIVADRFDMPAVEGGGGGLRFTGSRADARTCDSCHRGGPERNIAIAGLPGGEVEPGTTYELSLDAGDALRSAFVLEMEGFDPAGIGTLAVPEEATLAPEDECSNGVVATRIVTTPDGRSVAVADACGARRYRVLWTAPSSRSMDPTLRLHGGVVLADDSGGPTGDTAIVLDVALGAEAQTRPTSASSGCAASGNRDDGALVMTAVLVVAACAIRQRGRAARRDSRTRP